MIVPLDIEQFTYKDICFKWKSTTAVFSSKEGILETWEYSNNLYPDVYPAPEVGFSRLVRVQDGKVVDNWWVFVPQLGYNEFDTVNDLYYFLKEQNVNYKN